MRFAISSSYLDDKSKIIDEYPCLTKYGYERIDVERDSMRAIRDENGNFIMQKIGTYFVPTCYVTINTLEELDQFIKDVDCHVIVDTTGSEPYLEIYDGYRE